MTATRNDIIRWFETAKEQGATHLIVMCDTFDHDNYPVYVMANQDIAKEVKKRSNNDNMQRVEEVYNINKDMDKQLSQPRCMEY